MDWEKDKEEAIRIYAQGTDDHVNDDFVKKTNEGKGFNIMAGLFSALYLAYRKMYLYAIIALVAEDLCSEALKLLKAPSAVELGVSGGLFVLFGFLFYPLYQKHIKKKYEACENPDNWREELRTKGGTNGWVILAYIGLILVLWVIIMVLVNMGILTE